MAPPSQLTALADPTRLAIFELVRETPASVSSIAERLPVSQPAVSQHLRVLREASLVRSEAVGRRRIYRADRDGVMHLRAWADALWDEALDAFVVAAGSEAAR